MTNQNRPTLPCKVIIDLLPNYIDGLTSDETNAIVAEHLQSCPECKGAYEAMMRTDLDIALSETTSDDEKKVRYLKKIKSRHRKTMVSVVLGLLAVFIAAYYLLSIHIYSFPIAEMEIVDRCQFEDGTVYVKVLLNSDLAVLGTFAFTTHATDNQEYFEYQLGYTLVNRIMQKDKSDSGYLHFVFNPDKKIDASAVYCSAWGGGDRLMLWQEGDKLPTPTGEEAERLMDEIKPYLGIGYGHS